MRELRIDGTLILAVDHGYGNIKRLFISMCGIENWLKTA